MYRAIYNYGKKYFIQSHTTVDIDIVSGNGLVVNSIKKKNIRVVYGVRIRVVNLRVFFSHMTIKFENKGIWSAKQQYIEVP